MKIKLLAIADRPPKNSIKDIIKQNNIDLIATLGDLDYFSLKELKDITHIPKIGIYGNHCDWKYFDELWIINIHLKVFEYKGLSFWWFEWSIRYKQSSYWKMYTQEEAKQLLKDFPRVDIMISHSPPYGINDEPDSRSHQWFIALRDYIVNKKPKYFLHWHTYPVYIVDKFYDTNIIYVFWEKVVEVDV